MELFSCDNYLGLSSNHVALALASVRSALTAARAEVAKLEAAERELSGNAHYQQGQYLNGQNGVALAGGAALLDKR